MTTVPGANAVLSALQLSGLPSNAFYFMGFLPPKTVGRQKALTEVKGLSATLIIYETANRLNDMLKDILAVLGNRQMAVVREITKKFEEVKRGSVSELISYYGENGEPKGELVLVIGRAEENHEEWTAEKVEKLICDSLKTKTARDTVDFVVERTGLPKKQIYKQVVMLNEK